MIIVSLGAVTLQVNLTIVVEHLSILTVKANCILTFHIVIFLMGQTLLLQGRN